MTDMFERVLSISEVYRQVFNEISEFFGLIPWVSGTEILLTGLLVFLYWQQKQILRSDKTPEVRIEGYRGGEEEWGSPDNYLQIKLSNIGSGIATNFRIEYETNYEGDHTPISSTRPISRNTGGQKEWVRGSGDYLESGEKDEIFHSMLMIEWFESESEGHRGSSLPRCLEGLADEGIDEFEFGAWIHYTDQLGEKYRQRLFHYTNIPTDEDIETVNELFLYGTNPQSPDVHDYVLPPGTKLGEGGFVDVSEGED